jgi:hypothetical protein
MPWSPSQTTIPEYPTSNVVTEALAGLVTVGEFLRKPGILAPTVFYDIVSPWLNVRPYLSRESVTQGIERSDPGIVRAATRNRTGE